MRWTNTLVDVQTVWGCCHRYKISPHIGKQVCDKAWSCTVSSIDSNVHAIQTIRNRRLQVLKVLSSPFWEVRDSSQTFSSWTRQRIFWRIQQRFNFSFQFVWQLETISTKELDTVVFSRIVRCRDLCTSISLLCTNQVSNPWRWNNVQTQNFDTDRKQTSNQCMLKHLTRHTCITSY